uniref:Si:ch211-240b21.2 n=2 Tax=Nothobranchius kadleci TaxID=1051664 RepID=A0A1A8BMB8_NOTKA
MMAMIVVEGHLPPNSVRSLLDYPFKRRTMEEKILVKELGPHRPEINLQQRSTEKVKAYNRTFCRTWFQRKSWLTSCAITNALFCFPCILFQSGKCDLTWTQSGQTDLKHLSERIKKHERSRIHMENGMQLAVLGRVSIAAQLDEGHCIAVRRHNEEVDKNRHILSKIIDCVKFCGAFELGMSGHGESESSDNPGIFRGLVDLMASNDRGLREHLESATVFKGTSTTIQNELLDCMLAVLRERIVEEVNTASFLAIQVDKTTDISSHYQLVLVLRYIDKRNDVQERFFEFIKLPSDCADPVANTLLERLHIILPEGQENKLIAQAYDGAAVMRGTTGLQHRLQLIYPHAHYIHCYAHQLNLVMQQATSHIPEISRFFSDMAGFGSFFAKSLKTAAVLGEVTHQVPNTLTCWNFGSGAVSTVYEHKDDLVRCFETIRDRESFDDTTTREAGSFVRMLEDETFCFFLSLFHKIMPHVDLLYSELQKTNIDSDFIAGVIQNFINSMQTIREAIPFLVKEEAFVVPIQEPPTKKRKRMGEDMQRHFALEVCDTIVSHAKERFSFTKHLISATLVQANFFRKHSRMFPDSALDTALEAYPFLDKAKLKTELSLIYENEEFHSCSGAVALFRVLMENNLQDIFTETVSLLNIVITTPMNTSESKRCFSTSNRIKVFLKNTLAQDRLNALAMLSIEKKLTQDIRDFNTKVIEKYAAQIHRREKFMYK